MLRRRPSRKQISPHSSRSRDFAILSAGFATVLGKIRTRGHSRVLPSTRQPVVAPRFSPRMWRTTSPSRVTGCRATFPRAPRPASSKPGADSMEPTIADGDTLILDFSIDSLVVNDGGVFVISVDGVLLVKRL